MLTQQNAVSARTPRRFSLLVTALAFAVMVSIAPTAQAGHSNKTSYGARVA